MHVTPATRASVIGERSRPSSPKWSRITAAQLRADRQGEREGEPQPRRGKGDGGDEEGAVESADPGPGRGLTHRGEQRAIDQQPGRDDQHGAAEDEIEAASQSDPMLRASIALLGV